MQSNQWFIKHFSQLSALEFHNIIQVREAVFVVEQNCPYQDVDGKDTDAYHIWCENETGEVLCTARILKPGVSYPEAAIGRVCTAAFARGQKIGIELMKRSITFAQDELKANEIRISAQTYLLQFYTDLGFQSTGKEYLEDDIPHVEMLWK